MKIIEIQKLEADIDGKKILSKIDFAVEKGEIIAIMGPNGSGKSTLAKAIIGHPSIQLKGKILFEGKDLSKLSPDERARKGIFLAFQQPIEIPGITISNFIRTAINSRRPKTEPMKIPDYVKKLNENLTLLKIGKQMITRGIHEGLSGGEKKKIEMLQLAMLEPKLAILDETDSGLDIDALKQVCDAINIIKSKNKDLTILLITHYQKMLDYLKPDRVMVMKQGTIIKQGKKELMQEIEKKGYEGM
ncbi:MAG: Fe-S cluster assembly ATPase SufC [Candidatus Nanoarchaeia archaeon]